MSRSRKWASGKGAAGCPMVFSWYSGDGHGQMLRFRGNGGPTRSRRRTHSGLSPG